MKSFTKLGRTLLVLSVLALLPFSDAMSQNFIMETGGATYNATCGGVIKMKATSGQFVNNGGNTLGITAPANAIEGIVEWAATSATQTAQGLYYEKMMLSGAANKTIADGVYIVGEACDPADLLTGYGDFATYPFFITVGQLATVNDFQGTFNYIGDGQTTFPVTGDDSYNNLALDGTNHTIPVGTTTVDGTITLPTGPLAVDGTLNSGATSTLDGVVNVNSGGNFQIGTGDITFDGNVFVNNGGILNGGVGDIIIGASSTLALAGNTSIVDLDAGEELFITGNFTNGGDGTNIDFECTSVVTYNGTAANQLILPTITSNPYGILNLSDGSKRGGTAGYGNNIEICGNFSLADGNLDMLTNSGYVNMLNETSLANYTGLVEVEGAFRRQFTTAAVGPYTFNNSGTLLTFAGDAGFGPDAAGYYQLNIDGGTNPINYIANTDINRRIIPSYGGGIGSIEYVLQVAYLEAEVPGTFAAGLTEGDLKFFEADGAATTDVEKVAGTGYTRTNASGGNFGLLSLAGIIDGTNSVDEIIEREFTSGHDLVLRANNTMYSILDGRWSNPNVWDEGRIPDEDDNIEVRNLIYVGIDGPFAGTTGGADNTPTLNTRAEFDDYGSNPAANTIRIGNFANASLIIGNEDNTAAYIHKTKATGTAFTNVNTNTTVVGDLFTRAKNLVVKTNVNGLWLTSFGANPAVLGTAQIQNEGAINNQGIIEIGE
ncbi:MAG: hypothetical protein KIT33_09930 [Candidatus Kapabacteria bacterium]|nr:hypothetical protein [Ignavibacteriota bacterium]MCW5885276.1 hypothetical protein [Candidatus Kapabacteria bacterium]